MDYNIENITFYPSSFLQVFCKVDKIKTEPPLSLGSKDDEFSLETQRSDDEANCNDFEQAISANTSKPTSKEKPLKRYSNRTTTNMDRMFTKLLLANKLLHCDIYGFSAPRRYVMQSHLNHIKNNTGRKPFLCLVKHCDKRFRFYNTSLQKAHMRIHFEEKPHKCDECSKQYYTKYQLKEHKISTHNDSPK